MLRIGLGLALAALLLAAWVGFTAPGTSAPTLPTPEAHWRHPVALAQLEPGSLVTANRRSGSLSLVNLATKHVEEFEAGRSLVDVAVHDGVVLAVDEAANQLIRLRHHDGLLSVTDRLAVPLGPAAVRLSADGCRAYVTSRWGKSVSAIDLGDAMTIRWTTPLPFAPQPLTISPAGKHLVAGDAFVGQVALLDAGSGKLTSVRQLPGHNLGGFTWSPDGKHLLVAYSVMDQGTEATMYNVHWGNVVVHRLRQLDAASVLNPNADLLVGSKHYVLDGLTNGATDPGPGAFDPAGRMLLCIGGLDTVMLDARTDGLRERVRVGKRPAGVVVDARMNRAYVATTFDDRIAVLDLDAGRAVAPIALGPTPALTDEVRGEQLFHDARLSHNGWMSCHTCHSDGHTNGKRADTLADSTHGTPKRVLSLLGVAQTGPWNWRGQSQRLEDVIDRSLRTTMYPDDVLRDDIRALAAYLRTLPPPPAAPVVDVNAVSRGKALFGVQGCARCHTPPLYTSNRIVDVDIHDEKGAKEFNPPSLRGVRFGGPYFHDNRAATLADVFRVHKHQLKGELSAEEVRDLVAFLESL